MTNPSITFGDRVRVRAAPVTEGFSVAGRTGFVHGWTTPSVTGVSVIGDSHDDYAISVSIEGQDQQLWFAPALLEFVDHAEGTTMTVGDRRFSRSKDGEWREIEPS